MAGTRGAAAGRAVVVGGSMAGLLATRVLAAHFEQVVVVERDRLPEGPEHRKGVPQDWQPHLVLGRGRLAIERLFPATATSSGRQALCRCGCRRTS